MIIRSAELSDIDQMATLWTMFCHEMDAEAAPNKQWWIQYREQFLQCPNYLAVVAAIGSTIIGFADGMICPEPLTGKVIGIGYHIYVMPEFRQRNDIAGRIYRQIIRQGKAAGVCSVEFAATRNRLAFWKKKGYQDINSNVRRAI